MAASILFIIFFALILAALLTVIFAFEAFVMELYTGPGQKYIVSSFFFLSSPYPNKICSLSLVLQPHHPLPRVLALYQSSAKSFTDWENHEHQSTHDASLTLKTFSLSAIVAYLGLALSAFVYVPGALGMARRRARRYGWMNLVRCGN